MAGMPSAPTGLPGLSKNCIKKTQQKKRKKKQYGDVEAIKGSVQRKLR
jgi:hypothetical protein